MDLVGTIDSRIVGGGIWFRYWSKRVRQLIIRRIPKEDEISRVASFASPLELTISGNEKLKSNAESMNSSIRNFQRNLGAIFLQFPKLYLTPEEAKGLGFQRKRLECHTPSNWGKYEIRCDNNGKDFASFIHKSETRSKIMAEFYKPFNESIEFTQALVGVLRERKKFAQAMGFKSWTEMQAVMNGYPTDTLRLLESIYTPGQPALKRLTAKMKSFLPPGEQLSVANEPYLLNCVRKPLEFKKTELFEASATVSKMVKYFEKFLQKTIKEVKHSPTLHGWHKGVRVFHVEGHGYIYLDLYRRPFLGSPLAGSGPHCSVLLPSDEHVRIYLGIQPPYRSDVTFRKERHFTMEEITALMHEFGHAFHILLRPRRSPVSQLPMDLRESGSTLMELLSFSDDFLDYVSDRRLDAQDKKLLQRDDWFYLDILRNIAVAEFLHSEEFDLCAIKSSSDLRQSVIEVFSRFSPTSTANCNDFNPIAGELSNYIVDGESRVGYLVAYARSMAALRSSGEMQSQAFEFFNRTCCSSYEPSVSAALESRVSSKADSEQRPFPEFDALWERRPRIVARRS